MAKPDSSPSPESSPPLPKLPDGRVSQSGAGSRRPSLLFLVVTLLFVLIPFLFWRATWFGRPLSDKEIEKYLADEAKPRHIQHALSQMADRIVRHQLRPGEAKLWYPRVAALAQHRMTEIRVTAAWVMGQDNTSEEFHRVLLRLLRDPEPLVRRNASLSLVRFGDASGRAELVLMLRPYAVRSPRQGTLSIGVKENDSVNPGTLLARLDVGKGETVEIRSPLSGRVESKLRGQGTQVEAGDEVVVLSPGADQVWEALRALHLVGRPEDLPDVERFAHPDSARTDMPEKIQQQAALTAEAIRSRL